MSFCLCRLTHKVKINTVIHQIILPGFDLLRRRKIHPIRLARILDILIFARQTQHILVKLGQVLLGDLWRISRGITADEDGPHDVSMHGLDPVDHACHLVQLFGANIRAMREAKVHECVFALHVLLAKGLAVVVDELKGPADEGPAHAFTVFGDALAVHAVFFVAEVGGQAGA